MVIAESSMAADALEVRIAHLEGAYEQIDKRLGSLDGRAPPARGRAGRGPGGGVPRAHGERADRSRRAKAGCHLPLGDWHRRGQLDHPHARYISAPVTGRPHVDYSRRPLVIWNRRSFQATFFLLKPVSVVGLTLLVYAVGRTLA